MVLIHIILCIPVIQGVTRGYIYRTYDRGLSRNIGNLFRLSLAKTFVTLCTTCERSPNSRETIRTI